VTGGCSHESEEILQVEKEGLPQSMDPLRYDMSTPIALPEGAWSANTPFDRVTVSRLLYHFHVNVTLEAATQVQGWRNPSSTSSDRMVWELEHSGGYAQRSSHQRQPLCFPPVPT
jgi:hypothetical protein